MGNLVMLSGLGSMDAQLIEIEAEVRRDLEEALKAAKDLGDEQEVQLLEIGLNALQDPDNFVMIFKELKSVSDMFSNVFSSALSAYDSTLSGANVVNLGEASNSDIVFAFEYIKDYMQRKNFTNLNTTFLSIANYWKMPARASNDPHKLHMVLNLYKGDYRPMLIDYEKWLKGEFPPKEELPANRNEDPNLDVTDLELKNQDLPKNVDPKAVREDQPGTRSVTTENDKDKKPNKLKDLVSKNKNVLAAVVAVIVVGVAALLLFKKPKKKGRKGRR